MFFFVGGSAVECVLRGKMVLSQRGMPGGDVLRGNGVSFSAQEGKM